MRIALLHYTFEPVIGGVERVLRDQATALGVLGHRVEVMNQRGFEEVLRPRVTEYDAVIVHNVFTMPFDLGWTADLRELASRTAGKVLWINWVHDVASVNPFYAHLPWEEEAYKRLSQPVPGALTVAVSRQRQGDYARASGMRAEDIHVIHNGLDMPALLGLSPRVAQLELWENDLVLVHPTRLLRRKNIELGIRVAACLKEAKCKVLYAITGAPDPHQTDGQRYYQELKTLAAGLGVEKEVRFLGEVGALTDADVRSLYIAGDALFFPSVGEGFGLPLLEAMAHRMPVFCSDIGVHHEVLGAAGSYFDLSAKPEEISAQIVQWSRAATVVNQRRHLWHRHAMVKICQEHLEPLLATANQSA
ncbi:MAG TPA: glycosyltransferase family 4 protein [Prosthecobacter sp.]